MTCWLRSKHCPQIDEGRLLYCRGFVNSCKKTPFSFWNGMWRICVSSGATEIKLSSLLEIATSEAGSPEHDDLSDARLLRSGRRT